MEFFNCESKNFTSTSSWFSVVYALHLCMHIIRKSPSCTCAYHQCIALWYLRTTYCTLHVEDEGYCRTVISFYCGKVIMLYSDIVMFWCLGIVMLWYCVVWYCCSGESWYCNIMVLWFLWNCICCEIVFVLKLWYCIIWGQPIALVSSGCVTPTRLSSPSLHRTVQNNLHRAQWR